MISAWTCRQSATEEAQPPLSGGGVVLKAGGQRPLPHCLPAGCSSSEWLRVGVPGFATSADSVTLGKLPNSS